ncbi:putative secretion ATPase, PEP-CTERM locus subfamily [Novosphingobium sp. CF614]|uniref:XrtA/PEP-CTERM system-associated ATPase n=1 Tax=Novosphingobium sp. CF614 TaxID=1884364 RepID=UPI0008E6CFF1|nr:XrtA/PEP-CTERM system-associated ATPase [Novosphingobium sp. CF614]SFG27706.1 putative secretion ATPase, PEP-CTERM locus subfamily [Novosphingobium sp. CF614]
MFDDFYGLSGRPFQLTPDPAFYFESLTHRKALSYLGYGLAQGEGFVVITGEVGAGKSTLVAHLMATIDPARMSAANVVTSALDGEEIVHVVARAFGLHVAGHDKASALGAIEAFLHEEARAGRRCLLIVDEAQNLSIGALEELRMLSNFQLGSHPLLQTLLLGQPEFRETLLESDQLEQLRQRVIATHHLAAMQPKEVQAYIEHRMACVGWNGNPSFDQRVFAEIYQATGGIPRRVNQIVNRLLLLGAVDQRDRIDSAMMRQVLDELNDDGSLTLVSSRPQAIEPAVVAAAGAPAGEPAAPEEEPELALHAQAPAARPVDAFDAAAAVALIEAGLADRDAQIGELQQAVIELAAAAEAREAAEGEKAKGEDERVAALEARLAEANEHAAKLEARLGEQERTLRHTLTMLIEWIESGDGERQAA